jgi:hypothetical protein
MRLPRWLEAGTRRSRRLPGASCRRSGSSSRCPLRRRAASRRGTMRRPRATTSRDRRGQNRHGTRRCSRNCSQAGEAPRGRNGMRARRVAFARAEQGMGQQMDLPGREKTSAPTFARNVVHSGAAGRARHEDRGVAARTSRLPRCATREVCSSRTVPAEPRASRTTARVSGRARPSGPGRRGACRGTR